MHHRLFSVVAFTAAATVPASKRAFLDSLELRAPHRAGQ
jgi:hypothetical protein